MKIITGMHRGGTSLVARLFYEAGADMGDPNTFYRPDKWNPDGYFEQPDIHSINMPLINGPFWKFAYFRLPSTETILKRAASISTKIEQTSKKYQSKMVKETRFCLTLPAWTKYGAKIDKIIVCLRDPSQIARSLQKRNKITLKHAYYLWLTHNQRLLDNAKDIPLWFIYYGNLIDEDRFLEEIAPAFLFFDFHISEGNLKALGKIIVKPQMNHYLGTQDNYPDPVKSMWNAILERHELQFRKLQNCKMVATKL